MKKAICILLILLNVFYISAAFAQEGVSSNVLEMKEVELITPTPKPTPKPTPAPTPEPIKVVKITSDHKPVMRLNEVITLSSTLEGFDGYKIKYQWECDKHDDEGFKPIKNANKDTYKFKATAETLSWSWRLTVYYKKGK